MRSFITSPFSAKDFEQKQECDAVVFFPGLHEISDETISIFDAKTVFLDVGGLTRELGGKNEEGLYPIIQGHWKSIDKFRGKVDILKVSHEDLENIEFSSNVNTEEERVQNLSENGFPIVLLTRGERPTILVRKGVPIVEIPAYKSGSGDPAGAGEVFSIGFIYEYLTTEDPVEAVAFGNACASFKLVNENYDYQKAKQRTKEILTNTISS
jgi:sugar/nucleoside kinase (ribokinase family)